MKIVRCALRIVTLAASLAVSACSGSDGTAADGQDVKAKTEKEIGKVGTSGAVVLEGRDAFVIFSGKLHRYSLDGGVDEVVASLPTGADNLAISPRYVAVASGFPETLSLLDRQDGYKEVAKAELSVIALEFVSDDAVAAAGFGHVSILKADGTSKKVFAGEDEIGPTVRMLELAPNGKQLYALVEKDVVLLDLAGKKAPKTIFAMGDIGLPHLGGFRVDPDTGNIVSTFHDFSTKTEIVQLHDAKGKLLAQQDLGERMVGDISVAEDAIYVAQEGPTNQLKSQILLLDKKTLEVTPFKKYEGHISWLDARGESLVYVFTAFQKQARRLFAAPL